MKNVCIADAKRLLKSIGLVETTNKLQRKRGTIEFTDPKDKPVKYTLHANGYYRKHVLQDFNTPTCYQLNRCITKKNHQGGHDKTRILIPGEYLTMAARIVPIVIKSRERRKQLRRKNLLMF